MVVVKLEVGKVVVSKGVFATFWGGALLLDFLAPVYLTLLQEKRGDESDLCPSRLVVVELHIGKVDNVRDSLVQEVVVVRHDHGRRALKLTQVTAHAIRGQRFA